MVRYVKCPRCELNYIDADKQEYCDVCLAEMHGDRLQFADLDEDELEELDAELDSTELCSICGVNPVRFGEKVCDSCRQENSEYEEEEDIDIDKDEEWKNYLDEDDDGDLTVDDEELQEELEGELDEEDEEETYDEDDDFFEDLDSLSDLDDDEEEDEDEDDEEEDDDF